MVLFSELDFWISITPWCFHRKNQIVIEIQLNQQCHSAQITLFFEPLLFTEKGPIKVSRLSQIEISNSFKMAIQLQTNENK